MMPANSVDRFCAEHAEAIRVLERRVVGDIIEIGNRLIAVRDRLEHGRFLDWLSQEFKWSERTAFRYVAVAEAFGKTDTVSVLEIDAGARYMLAGPTVPEPARETAIKKAERGDRITKAEAEKLIRESVQQAVADYRRSGHEQVERAIDTRLHGGFRGFRKYARACGFGYDARGNAASGRTLCSPGRA
jgi:hypothetical protein